MKNKNDKVTDEEYNELQQILKDNPPEPYEQSEKYGHYYQRKWEHREKIIVEFLKRKGRKHF